MPQAPSNSPASPGRRCREFSQFHCVAGPAMLPYSRGRPGVVVAERSLTASSARRRCSGLRMNGMHVSGLGGAGSPAARQRHPPARQRPPAPRSAQSRSRRGRCGRQRGSLAAVRWVAGPGQRGLIALAPATARDSCCRRAAAARNSAGASLPHRDDEQFRPSVRGSAPEDPAVRAPPSPVACVRKTGAAYVAATVGDAVVLVPAGPAAGPVGTPPDGA